MGLEVCYDGFVIEMVSRGSHSSYDSVGTKWMPFGFPSFCALWLFTTRSDNGPFRIVFMSDNRI